MTNQQIVLTVENLRVIYHTPTAAVRAVNNLTFALHKGERRGEIHVDVSRQVRKLWITRK